MRGVYSRVCFVANYFLQYFLRKVRESFTGDIGSEDDIYTGVRTSIIGKVMIGCVVGRNRYEIIVTKEVFEEQVALVIVSRDRSSICITSPLICRTE